MEEGYITPEAGVHEDYDAAVERVVPAYLLAYTCAMQCPGLTRACLLVFACLPGGLRPCYAISGPDCLVSYACGMQCPRLTHSCLP